MITPTDLRNTCTLGKTFKPPKAGSSDGKWPAAVWAGFFTASLAVFCLLSEGRFSFLLTYGGMARVFGLAILNAKIYGTQSASGVSIKTLQLYSLVFLSRLLAVFRSEAYLPYDATGDWLYHLLEGASLLLAVTAIVGCTKTHPSTYQASSDTFGEYNVPPGCGAVYLAAPIALLALIIHPNNASCFLSNTSWAFAMYLESAALIPQLYMFTKSDKGVVELLNAHCVAALGLGRCMELFFWVHFYHHLHHKMTGFLLPGHLTILVQVGQLLLMADFFWYYYLAVKNKSSTMVLPTSANDMIGLMV